MIKVYLEIEKNSNIKYEFDKSLNKLVVDRILPEPYYYPHAYGFIPNTLGSDGDDLDILLITDKIYKIDTYLDCYIIGGLKMEDDKGMDEKLFVVPIDECSKYQDISNISTDELNKISEFFSNYKSKSPNKWSKVHGFMKKVESIELYNKCKL